MAESGGSNEVEVKVVFKADTSELDAAKKSLGNFDTAEDSGGSGLNETAEVAEKAEENLEELNENLSETGENLEELGEKAEEAAENLGALSENTETIGGNLETLGEQADAAAQNLEDLSGNAEEAGSNLADAGDAAEDIGSALDDLSDNAENAADQISAVGDAAGDAADGVKEAGEAAEQLGEGFDSAGAAAEKAAGNLQNVDESVKGTAEGFSGVGDAVKDLSESLSEISEATEGAADNLSAVSEAGEEANDNLSAISEAADALNENLSSISEAGEETADNISGVEDAAGEAEASLGSLGDSAGDAADQIGDVGSSGQDAADGVEDIGAAADDASGHFERIIGLLEEISAKLDSAGSAARTTGEEVKKAGDEAEKSVDTFKDFSEAIGKFESLGSGLKGFSANLIGIGKDAIDAAGEFEQLKAKLITIQKSTEAANETFEYAKTLAASTPFDVKGVVDAAVQLEVYGQKSKELLPVVANLASAMGGDVSSAATAMGRALSGSSEGLQSLRDSFGVNTDKLVKFGAALNKQGGIAVDSAEDIEKLKKALVSLVNTEFAGGIERQAATIAGAMGNVEDEITNTKAAIGDVFAPYVSVISEHVADLLHTMQGFAPVIAVVGGLAAATAGLAGTFITSAASAVGLGVAIKALRGDYEKLNQQIDAFKVKNAGVYSASKAVGLAMGGLTAAFMVYEGASLYLEKWIADEKKAQAEIAAQSRELVNQRQKWDDVRKAIEGATGAKVKFSVNDKTAGAVDMAEAAKQIPAMVLSDALSKKNLTQDDLNNFANARKKEYEEAVQQRDQAQKELNDYVAKNANKINNSVYNQQLEGSSKFYNQQQYESEWQQKDPIWQGLQEKVKNAQYKAETNKYQYDQAQEIVDRNKQITDRMQASEKAATADIAYADFAIKAKDADALTDSIEHCRQSLASLYAASKGQSFLSDAQLKDPTERLERMGELIRSGQQDGLEFNYLKAINELEEKQEELYKVRDERRNQSVKDAEQAVKEQFDREQAGRDQSLEAEKAYWEEILATRKSGRQAMVLAYGDELRQLKNGANPGERERLQGNIDKLQRLSPGEIEAINKLHELDKKQAAESFSSLITPLREAADELSSKVTAKPADQVAAWKLVVDKAKEWGQTNAQILAQSPELKKQFESDLKGIETEYKRVQEAAANTVLTNLSEKASEKIGSVSSQTAQLDAVREAERLYQQTLRTSKELQASDAARQQAQKQLNSLKQQELKLIEQIKETQKQVENETASLEVQIEEERLAAMQDRANSGEDMSKQILAQEQKIQEMRLQQLEEAKKQELEKIVGTSEEAARLRLAVEKKYQDQVTLLTMQHQRKLAQEQRSFDSKQDKLKHRPGKAEGTGKEESSWKPGSPLMTLQDMLSKHNSWFANAGNDFMKDAASKTNTMSGAAENASDKLHKLANSAEAAAGGLAGSGGGSSSGLTAAAIPSIASVGAGSAINTSYYTPGYTSLPKSSDVYFPSADRFGSAVHTERLPDAGVNNVHNTQNSTYNMNFDGKAVSVNAVDAEIIANHAAIMVRQRMRRENKFNSMMGG